MECSDILDQLLEVVRRLVVVHKIRHVPRHAPLLQYQQDAIWNIYVFVHENARKSNINQVVNEHFLNEDVFMEYWLALEEEHQASDTAF